MSSLSDCFSKVVKKSNLLPWDGEQFILEGGDGDQIYESIVLAKNSDNLVVFNVGKNAHSSFVKDTYNRNCDYIFIRIDEDEITFILCELKQSINKKTKGIEQLKYSVPLAQYLRQLLITHCETNLESLKINFIKILLVRYDKSKETTTSKPEIKDDVAMFFGEEFALNEFLETKETLA